MEPIIGSVFRAFEEIFTSESIHIPSALHALRLTTRISSFGVSKASYGLFKAIVGLDNLTDQHWEAARFTVYAAFRDVNNTMHCGDPKEIVKFLDYHVGVQGAKEDHQLYISSALQSLLQHPGQPNPHI